MTILIKGSNFPRLYTKTSTGGSMVTRKSIKVITRESSADTMTVIGIGFWIRWTSLSQVTRHMGAETLTSLTK